MKNEARRKKFKNADHVSMAPGRVLIEQKPVKNEAVVHIHIPNGVAAETKAAVTPYDYLVHEVGEPVEPGKEAPCKPGDRVLLMAQAVNQYVITEIGLFDKEQRIRAIILPFEQIQGVFDER